VQAVMAPHLVPEMDAVRIRGCGERARGELRNAPEVEGEEYVRVHDGWHEAAVHEHLGREVGPGHAPPELFGLSGRAPLEAILHRRMATLALEEARIEARGMGLVGRGRHALRGDHEGHA